MGIKMTGNSKLTLEGPCYIGPVWRTMKSAPKDGTKIIGCNLEEEEVEIIYWLRDQWVSSGDNFYPTHWMVEPDLPNEENVRE